MLGSAGYVGSFGDGLKSFALLFPPQTQLDLSLASVIAPCDVIVLLISTIFTDNTQTGSTVFVRQDQHQT